MTATRPLGAPGEPTVSDHRGRAGSPALPSGDHRRQAVGIVLGLLCLWLVPIALAGEGFLSPDIGAKVATLEAMTRRGDLAPHLDTWAATIEPEGSIQPFNMSGFGDRWVAVTTLPALYLSLPFYALAGYRGALVVPVAGAIAAALAAGALARRLGQSPGAARRATLVVGAAGPVTVYALQLWEHTAGLALMAWGVVWAIDAARGDRAVRPALWSGLAFGAATALRQEALVYAAVAVAAVAVAVRGRAGWRAAARTTAATAVGMVVAVAANLAVEVAAVGAPLRTGRSAQALQGAGAQLAARLEGALASLAAPVSSGGSFGLVAAGLLAVGLTGFVAAIVRGGRPLVPGAMLATAVAMSALFQVVVGPAFVPGLLAAAPVAAAGLVAVTEPATWRNRPTAVAATIAVGSLPLVWAVQYVEGVWPQWGARYLLTSGLVLTVLGLGRLEGHNRLRAALVAASVTVTGLGVATHLRHTEAWEPLMAHIEAETGVVVFDDRFLAQQMGTLVLDRPWLSARTPTELDAASRALSTVGVDRFLYVAGRAGEPAIEGYETRSETTVEVLGHDIRLLELVAAPTA